MAVQPSSRPYGLLVYNPSASPSDPNKPPTLFRPRRVGPGRIRIQPVADGNANPGRARLVPFPRPKNFIKLAVSRENAKRFLRSVIANPNSSDQAQPSAAEGKRRSWSPVKRAQSGGQNTGVVPPEEAASVMRPGNRGPISGPLNAHIARPRGSSDMRRSQQLSTSNAGDGRARSPSLAVTTAVDSVIPPMGLDDEKPIASGNGVMMSIHLAEPVLFLQGFDNSENSPGNTAMLRGRLHIRVQKAAKIKAVTLKFKGKAITKWPEGIPPRKVEFDETDTIMSHTWPFFNAQFDSAERGTNADHVQLLRGPDGTGKLEPLGSSPNVSTTNLSVKDARKLALSVNQSRSFGKGDPVPGTSSVAAKGYRTFLPGDYIYNFELPLDSRLPESIDVELGSVKYELEASIERSGAFRANLLGTKEISLIRAPAEGSLEQVEPIAISRNWEDQLHYDIVISGKSFPLGAQVPIAFKLTPLAKVQCHRIKVLVTENIEYFCSNKRVHRMEPTRKVQLFEKRSDGPAVSTFPGSTMRVTAGGGIPYDSRAAAARGEEVPPSDTSNLLGHLEGDSSVGPTEMEFSVQLPSCHVMKERDRTQRLHFDTTYSNIQVHHWIKIVMRLSKPDLENPGKRRHFEISIDSPFHILSCRATQANISLPAYTSPLGATPSNPSNPANTSLYECGCPGAARRRHSPSYVPTLQTLQTSRLAEQQAQQQQQHSDPERSNSTASTLTIQSPALTRPPIAHIPGTGPGTGPPQQTLQRPIHLLRAPSFNPPAFSDEPPPPLITPPPQYDSIASPTHGLSDYFARLSDAYDEDGDEEDDDGGVHRGGRVNVPLTPGARVNRSMDMRRTWVPVGGTE